MSHKPWFRTPRELLEQRLMCALRERLHAQTAVDVLTGDGTGELRRRAAVAALEEVDARIVALEGQLAAMDAGGRARA
jgi:hypothetical protein